MKKYMLLLLALCLSLAACGDPAEPRDYTGDIVGLWYAVEYETEYVEFLADGTVEDTFNGQLTRGFWKLDNENALLWINFGDDVFSIRIREEDGRIILLDNNGTLVREADLDTARAEYAARQTDGP